jgi:hypothetical protein
LPYYIVLCGKLLPDKNGITTILSSSILLPSKQAPTTISFQYREKKFWKEQFDQFPYLVVAHECVQPSHKNDVITMVIKLNLSWSHVVRFKFCIHLRSMNISHFGMVEVTGRKIMTLRSLPMP